MSVRPAAVAALLLTVAAAGCEPPRVAQAEKATPPAKVAHPAKEDDLNTVVLTAEAESRLGLTTATVARKPVARTRSIAGDVVVPPGRLIIVAAPLVGTLQAPEGGIPTPGTAVKKGQAIVSLLPLLSPEARATMGNALVAAEGDVEQARKALEVAEVRLRREERLQQGSLSGKGALVDAQKQHETAQTALKAAEGRRDSLSKTMAQTEGGALKPLPIPAPEDGMLRNVAALAGQQVAAGATLFEVERLDPVWVRVPVYVGDLRQVASDRPARIGGLADAPAAPTIEARPVAAPPSGDPLAITADLFYEVANPDHALRPGEKVAVTLPLRGQEEGLVVPASALYYDIQGGTWVYEQVKDHTYVRRRVEVDHVTGDSAVLARGPQPGAKVVTVGVAELYGTEFGFSK